MSFMKTDTGCRYPPRHLIISCVISARRRISKLLQLSATNFARVARGSPLLLLLLLLLSLLHYEDDTFFEKKKKFRSKTSRSKIIHKRVIKISAPFRAPSANFIIATLSLLSFRLSFSTLARLFRRQPYSRGKFSTIPPTFALTRPTCSTCFQSDNTRGFFFSIASPTFRKEKRGKIRRTRFGDFGWHRYYRRFEIYIYIFLAYNYYGI